MPRDSGGRDRDRREPGADPPGAPLELTEELRALLLPWLDVREVGADGVAAWLRSTLPLLPRPETDARVERDRSRAAPDARVAELAQALADCAAERARAHFQASEYFRENRVLARRVKALEAIARTRARADGSPDPVPDDPIAERAARRYLPP